MSNNNNIKENIDKIKERVNKKNPGIHTQINIEAVTKTRTVEDIKNAINAGIKIISENRIQEAENKLDVIKSNKHIKAHLIGHLQSNKIKKAIELFDTIESVDTKKKINKINNESNKKGKTQEIYLQINIGNDSKKHGFNTQDAQRAVKTIQEYNNINLTGLMTILPFGILEEETKGLYKNMKLFYDKMREINPKITNLSMGMSNDYGMAVECGASHIRIGTAIFGKKA